jgi:glycosyltransferase involved in cell wall biosynthesis
MVGSRDDVPRLMAESDVFVFPSLPAGEGMPGVLIEAGLSGLATVSTRVPGARDVVEEGVTGLLVDIDNKLGFIEAVGRLVSDEELRRSMGERARQRCLQRFTLEASARRWRGLLSQLESSVSGADQKAGR